LKSIPRHEGEAELDYVVFTNLAEYAAMKRKQPSWSGTDSEWWGEASRDALPKRSDPRTPYEVFFSQKLINMNLNQVTVPVKNVPASIEFYKKLGLTLIVHTHDDYARFECPGGDSTFSLHRVDQLPSSNGIWVYFEVPDVDKQIELMIEAGIDIEEQPKDQTWLWREAKLKDLDGNQIIIYHAGENRKNPPWRC
jgi:catechol 2,3-dioxygenase-like lactoylglutathione lyase family enzyme